MSEPQDSQEHYLYITLFLIIISALVPITNDMSVVICMQVADVYESVSPKYSMSTPEPCGPAVREDFIDTQHVRV